MNNSGFKQEWSIVGSSSSISGSKRIEKNGQTPKCKQYFNFSHPRVDLPTNYDKCPDEIDICISNDVDLPKIHLAIKSRMIFVLKQNEMLQIEATKIINKLVTLDEESLEYSKLSKRLISMDDELNSFDVTEKWDDYESQAVPILNDYVELMSSQIKGIVVTSVVEEEIERVEQRIALIILYIELVSKLELIEINISYKYDDLNTCPACGDDMDEFEISTDGKYTCKCGYFDDETTQNTQGQGQTDIINIPIPKIKPDILISMDRWLNRFLGTSEETIPETKMFEKFDEVCIKHGWPTGEEVRSGSAEADLELLIKIMSLAEYPAYYKMRNIIRHKYHGWPLPTMTEEQKSRFRNTIVLSQEVYPKHALRKQNINQDIRGWYHCKDAGADFLLSWFKTTKNISTLEEADYVYEKICKDCSMTFYPILQKSLW